MTIQEQNAAKDAYNTPFTQAENILIAAREKFNYHPSRQFPDGYRMLMRAQYHINCVRCGIKAR